MKSITNLIWMMFICHWTVAQISNNAPALEVDSVPESTGLFIKHSKEGILLKESEDQGLLIEKAGGEGVKIDRSDGDGISVINSGGHGVFVSNSAGAGFRVVRAGGPATVTLTGPVQNGLTVHGAEDDGVYIASADDDGVYVKQAGGYGIRAQGDLAAGYFEGNIGVNTGTPTSILDLRQPNSGQPIAITMQTNNSWPLIMSQSTSSVFSIENGGAKRLSILANGRVGIGTTAPDATFHVNGSVKWAPKTSYISVDAAAFSADYGSNEYYIRNSTTGLTVPSAFGPDAPNFSAGIQLPHRAIVQKMTVSIIDQNNTPPTYDPFHIILYRKGISNVSRQTMASIRADGSSNELRILTDDTVLQPTVDNENWSYFIQAVFPTLGNVDGVSRLRGVSIEYTIDQPY